MTNEFSVLASSIEAGNVPLPPTLSKLIQNAPESFDDLRAGEVALTVRAMRKTGEPIDFVTVGAKFKGDLLTFICSELSNAAHTLSAAEFYAEQCWQAFLVRRAKSVGQELINSLENAPKQAQTSIAAARVALAVVNCQLSSGLPDLIDAAAFVSSPIAPPLEIIAGILHQGGKLVFGGSSKSFKTWSLLDVAISVATGSNWLGLATKQGKVLYLNFEIQLHAWQQRIVAVAKAKGVDIQPGAIQLCNLRGYAAGFRRLIPQITERCRAEKFALIVVDPIYKLYGGIDENAAGDVAELLNSLENLAVETGAAIAFGAHFAKGNVSAKDAIDRISGSGVFVRDPDSLIIFTKHERIEAFVVEPILRNFAPVKPFAVRWNFPLMERANDLDPTKLKTVSGRKPIYMSDDLLKILPNAGLSSADWQVKARDEGISKPTFYRLRKSLLENQKIHQSATTGFWQTTLT